MGCKKMSSVLLSAVSMDSHLAQNVHVQQVAAQPPHQVGFRSKMSAKNMKMQCVYLNLLRWQGSRETSTCLSGHHDKSFWSIESIRQSPQGRLVLWVAWQNIGHPSLQFDTFGGLYDLVGDLNPSLRLWFGLYPTTLFHPQLTQQDSKTTATTKEQV